MKLLLLLLLLLLGSAVAASQPTSEVDVPNHVAINDMAFVFFTPDQILASAADTHNASAICRMLPSRRKDAAIEDHAIVCFSNMEQYGVRFSNATRLTCLVEYVHSSVNIEIKTPVLQNSCVLHPVLLPFDHGDQVLQADLFVDDHANVCRGSADTLATCRSIDNHTFMELLATYHFQDNQIVLVNHARKITDALLDLAVDFIKYYWKK